MNDVLLRYIDCFLHPIESQKRRDESESNVIGIHGHKLPSYKLSFEEGLAFSWLFALMQAFYTVLIMGLGIQIFTLDKGISSAIGSSYAVKIFFIVLEALLFPLSYWFYTRFWSKVVFLCSQMFALAPEENGESICEDIIVKAMTAHGLLVVPFFGQLFSQLLLAIYLFQGVKTRLQFSSLQALFVMLVPFFLLFLFFGLMIITLVIALAGVR